MVPITLLNKGSLVARMGESQNDLDKLIPIDYIMNWFETQLNSTKSNFTMSDRVVILLSKTGSGKSTAIAPNLYLRFFDKYKKRILITEPRVLTTIEIPKDISRIVSYKKANKKGLSIQLFKNLGYQTQEFVKKPKEKGILFTTTGILLQFLKNMTDAEFIKKFKFVIIDEAHDRSLDVDLVLFLMKQLIQRNLNKNPPFLILMSATLNVTQYSNYFGSKTIFEVAGQSKPIEDRYPKYNIDNIFSESCKIVKDIQTLEKEGPGPKDIIIFMPNAAYINKMTISLEKLNETLKSKLLIIPITSMDIGHGSEGYRLLFSPIDQLEIIIHGQKYKPNRRVIIATNVAETGLSLDSLKYCIDSGLVFSAEFNHRHGSNMLIVKPVTASMSLQRKGRIGRKFSGIFYPLFTKDTFNHMTIDNTPDILVNDISSHILAMLQNDSIDDIYKLFTPPSIDSINYSLEKLYVLGAIDSKLKITKLGTLMNVFRKLELEQRKLILTAFGFKKHIKDIVILTAMLSLKKSDIFKLNNFDKNVSVLTGDKILNKFTSSDDYNKYNVTHYNKFKYKVLVGCEFIELILVYHAFINQILENTGNMYKVNQWCISNGLNFNTLNKLVEQIDELYWQLIDSACLNPFKHKDESIYNHLALSNTITNSDFIDSIILIKKIIYEGYKLNLLTYNEDLHSYVNNQNVPIIVDSPLVNDLSYQKNGKKLLQSKPKYLIYKNLLLRKNPITLAFEMVASTISVLDGFVNIDISLPIS